MRTEIRQGAAAWSWLESPDLRAEWDRLYAACPWGTVFQSYAYVWTWYDVYRSRFAPVIVTAAEDDGELVGLLTLAVGAGGELVPAGGRQAEYQVWLARPGEGDAFIAAALERLARAYPAGMIFFRYLPPGTPRAWLSARRGIARRCVLRPMKRGLKDASEAAVAADLKEKRNRTRVRRLERGGPLTFERLTDVDAIDRALDEIIPFCDLRHGALHDVMPFGDDPLKAPFYRALARQPRVLYVSALRCGGEIVCANFDADNRGEVALGATGFSPAVARHSPTRIHLLLLARHLARNGYRSVDLTPGDDPVKGEWATRFDEAYTLHVFLSASRFARHTTAARARRMAKAVVGRAGADPTRVGLRLARWLEPLRSLGIRRGLRQAARLLGRQLWSGEEIGLYEFAHDSIPASAVDRVMRRDCVSELTTYRPGALAQESRRDFFLAAFRRLEHGAHSFTRLENGQLVACGWVKGPPGPNGDADVDGELPRPSDAALVYDLRVSERVSADHEVARMLAQLVHEAAAIPGAGRVLVAAPSARPAVWRAAEKLGGRRVGAVSAWTRLGRTRVRSTIPDGEAPAPFRPGSSRGPSGRAQVGQVAAQPAAEAP